MREEKGTHTIVQGSFRPLTIWSACHFSFFTDGKCVITSFADACVGLISHHGQSVSIMSLSDGMVVIAKRFSSVFNELKRDGIIEALPFLLSVLNENHQHCRSFTIH